MTKTPPPGPGRAVSIPRISSSRIASLTVASATPKRRAQLLLRAQPLARAQLAAGDLAARARARSPRPATRGSSSGRCASSSRRPSGHPFSVGNRGRTYHALPPVTQSSGPNDTPRPTAVHRSGSTPESESDRGAPVFIASSTACGAQRARPRARADTRPWWKHDDAVAQRRRARRCRSSRCSTGAPAAAARADQRVHLGLGADVDAARRVVEQQHRRLRVEPLGEHDLLLVAARQRARALVDRAACGPAGRATCSRARARRRPRARSGPVARRAPTARIWPMFSQSGLSSIRPSRRRSPETSATPARDRAAQPARDRRAPPGSRTRAARRGRRRPLTSSSTVVVPGARRRRRGRRSRPRATRSG